MVNQKTAREYTACSPQAICAECRSCRYWCSRRNGGTRQADYLRQIPWNGENCRTQELQETKDAEVGCGCTAIGENLD